MPAQNTRSARTRITPRGGGSRKDRPLLGREREMAERKQSARAIRMHGRDVERNCCAVTIENEIVYCPLHGAAPELLEVLKEIHTTCNRSDDSDDQLLLHVDDIAQEAIEKAKGG